MHLCFGVQTWRKCTQFYGLVFLTVVFSSDNVKVVVMSTFEHRSFELADVPIVFNPHSDLAILNYIANYIIQNDK